MNLTNLKRLFLKSLIGCLVAAASLAVVTILMGDFNDVSAKALVTILLVAAHCLISFGFIVNNERQETFENLSFFANATFILIVLSFITSVLGVWGILPGSLVGKLYALYFVLLFATLHGEILAKTLGKQGSINNLVSANYVFMGVVVLMLLPVIFLEDSSSLGSFYYRLLGAFGIVDATLTLIVVIMHKLYVQKHPALQDNVFNAPDGQIGAAAQPGTARPHRGMNIFVTLLIVYIVLQFIGGIAFALIGAINR